jgi:fatty acid desaturase
MATAIEVIPDDLANAQGAQGGGLREIRAEMKKQKLFDFQPLFYIREISMVLVLLAVSILTLVSVDSFLVQLGNAVLLAFVLGKAAHFGHDAGHKSISGSAKVNYYIGLLATLIISMSREWWLHEHDQHHKDPNGETDPHRKIPYLVFNQYEAHQVRGSIRRFIIGYQAAWFIPYVSLECFGLRLASILFLSRLWRSKEGKFPWLEPIVMVIHFIAYGLLLRVSSLSLWEGVGFVALHYVLFGLYFSLNFAPNHKGEEEPNKNVVWDSAERQIRTTRSLRSSKLARILYGGLERQIEHHLVPTRLPRPSLEAMRPIVVDYCKRNGLTYHETGIIEGYVEVLKSLHEAAAPLRRNWFRLLRTLLRR